MSLADLPALSAIATDDRILGAAQPAIERLPRVRARARRLNAHLTVALVMFVLLGAATLAVGVFGAHEATESVGPSMIRPGGDHLLGTDSAGLDVFTRVFAAARLDLSIGVLSCALAALVGVPLGLALGAMSYGSRLTRAVAGFGMRLIDLSQALPSLVLAMVLVAFFGSSLLTVVVSLALAIAPNIARLARGELIRLWPAPYLESAKVSGLRTRQVVARHVLPNSADVLLPYLSTMVGVAIVVTAGLGFVGAGFSSPTAEWGSMMAGGATDLLYGSWWAALAPAAALGYTVVAFSVLGEGLRRQLGRRSRHT